MPEIELRGRNGNIRAVTVVDEEDFELLTQWRWCLLTNTRPSGYTYRAAVRGRPVSSIGSNLIYMHRQIMGLDGERQEVDHRNRDQLDNRRSNLRIVQVGTNQQNTDSRQGSTSAHRGVSWNSAAGKWMAQAATGGKNHYLGLYDKEQEAAEVAKEFRRKHLPMSLN